MLPDIRIHGLSLKFNQQVLFEELSFTLEASKWTSILGASGVGKSTLLQYLAGLICKDTNDTQLSGEIQIPENFKLSQNTCYMAQGDNLMPWLNAYENTVIAYRLRQQKIDAHIKKNCLELFEKVGLSDALKKYPPQLSGGMRQRVALVRTLLENRPIVLMDEPFSALDAITRLKLQDLASDLLKNKTVLLVTHDPLEALRLSDKIYVLSDAPAHLGEEILLSSKTPRKTNDPEILNQQAKLFGLLLKASQESDI